MYSFRHFTSVRDVGTPDAVQALVRDALELYRTPLAFESLGKHKTVGLLFFNSSLRTRVSTQRAARNLGMDVFVVNVGSESWKLELNEGSVMDGDTVEHIKEGAAVLGEYCDILAVRAFADLQDRFDDYSEHVLKNIIRYSGVPVVSLESATRHPLQSLADLITMTELRQARSIKRPKVVLTWAPHPRALPQAVANSFAEWVLAWQQYDDVEFVITHPEGFELSEDFTRWSAEHPPARVITNQHEALEGADFVYVKNWSPFVQQRYGAALGARWRDYKDWTLTQKHLRNTNDARVLHCLPTRRNVELADDVLDSPSSAVIHEAAHRITAAQAVFKAILTSEL
jgi:N-succinyl-L-ornithine transcarbamylase